MQPVCVPEVTREAIAGTRAHRLNADLDPACTPGGPLLHTLRAGGEATVVHVPDSQCQWREALEVVPGKVLLTVTEINGFMQFTQLWKRSEIGEDGTLGVHRPRMRDVPQQRYLPVQVGRLLGAVPHAETGPGPALAVRRQVPVPHERTED